MKNDINLIQKRSIKQYSSKSLALTIGIVVVLGVGIFVGITLPSKNLAVTKAAINDLENQLQQYSILAINAGSSGEDTDIPQNAGLDTIYIERANQLKSLEEQLESFVMIATAESNALSFLNSIEESLPEEVNITSLNMADNRLNLYGTASGDKSLAVFCLRLKETNLFEDVFVSSSMITVPGETTTIFNLTATLSEPLESIPSPDAINTTDAQADKEIVK